MQQGRDCSHGATPEPDRRHVPVLSQVLYYGGDSIALEPTQRDELALRHSAAGEVEAEQSDVRRQEVVHKLERLEPT